MAITFGGLATGMDTESIISALMDIERAPIKRLETDKAYFNNRLDAFTELDGKLEALMTKAKAIDSEAELNTPTAEVATEGYFTASASSTAGLGSYQVKVVDMAQLQKDYSAGYADKGAAEFGTGSLTLTVAGTPNSITIDATNNSLEGIAAAINDSDLGVRATIINDGTASPYRLVLTGDTVQDSFSLDASGLTGGTYAAPSMTSSQAAQQAHIIVDGIDIYSDTNTFEGAIQGVTLDILKADPDPDPAVPSSNLAISSNPDASKEKINDFVSAYNDIINFIAEQKDADWGNEAAFRAVKRSLQDLVSKPLVSGGSFSSLSQIGFETQRDGTLLVNGTDLTDAMSSDFSGVIGLFAGDGTNDGISQLFIDYLDGMTDSVDGMLATKKESTESTVKRIDSRIDNLELRMEAREKTLRAQFSAMEELVSALGSQGSYLAQQMASMPTIGNK